MPKSWNFHKSLHYIFRILIGIDIVRRSYVNTDEFIFSLSLFIVILVNDHLRMNHFYKNDTRYFISILVTMIVTSLLILKIEGYTAIFIYIILYELILFSFGKISTILTILEIMFFFFLLAFEGIESQYIIGSIMDSALLFFYVFMLYTYKKLGKEKRKVELLNKEIEELTIAKERNRLAGEIHDNLGHSLMALNMNLDVTGKIIDKDPDKAKSLIDKSQIITKESIEELRAAVYALKGGSLISLRDSITKLVDNLQDAGETKFSISIDQAVESLPRDYKENLLQSIKEAITNSIKHGNPELVNINIDYMDLEFKVTIKDDGKGCSDLVKGSGLLNIENRLQSLGGKVAYKYGSHEGFQLTFVIGWLK